MLLFDATSPGRDARAATQRLKKYYKHAAAGGAAPASAFLTAETQRAAFEDWRQRAPPALDDGARQVLRAESQARRLLKPLMHVKFLQRLFDRWHELATHGALLQFAAALSPRHEQSRSLRRWRDGLAEMENATMRALAADVVRGRHLNRRWRAGCEHLVTQRAVLRQLGTRASLRRWLRLPARRALWASLCARGAASAHAAALRFLREAVARWIESAIGRAQLADVSSRVAWITDVRRASGSLYTWRDEAAAEARRAREYADEVYEATLPPLNAVDEARRFILSWRFRQRRSLRRWRYARPHSRWAPWLYLIRWKHEARLLKYINTLVDLRTNLSGTGLAMLRFKRHHKLRAAEDKMLLTATRHWLTRVAMRRLRESCQRLGALDALLRTADRWRAQRVVRLALERLVRVCVATQHAIYAVESWRALTWHRALAKWVRAAELAHALGGLSTLSAALRIAWAQGRGWHLWCLQLDREAKLAQRLQKARLLRSRRYFKDWQDDWAEADAHHVKAKSRWRRSSSVLKFDAHLHVSGRFGEDQENA